jgi:hypothetical protein
MPPEGTAREATMRRVLTRSVLAGTFAATLLAGTTLAHECFVYSRSDMGDLKAGSHSKVWETVGETKDIFLLVGDLFGLDPLSNAQLDWAVEAGKAEGLPNQFTIFIGKKTIAEGTPAMDKHGADGKGIDHAFDWIPVVLDVYAEALTH